MSRILAVSLLSLVMTAPACGGRTKIDPSRGMPPSGLSVMMSGEIDEELLENPQYALKCDGRAELLGQVTTRDPQYVVAFPDAKLDDGTSCYLEIRAAAKPGIQWLTSPAREGLYYISAAAKARGNALALKLYQVFEKGDGEQPTAPLVVSTSDGGICRDYDLATHACSSETDGDGALVQEKLGLTLGGTDEIVLDEVKADSPAAKAGLTKGDFLLLVDAQEVKDVAKAYALLGAALANAEKSEVLLSIVSNGSPKTLTVDLSSAR